MTRFLTRSLMARLVIYFLLLSVVSVGLVAYSAFLRAREALTQSIYERLRAVATLKEDELNRWVGDQSLEVLLIAHLPDVHAQAQILLGSASPEAERRKAYDYLSTYLNAVVASRRDLQEIFIMADADGLLVLSTDATHEGQLRAGELYFSEGRWRTYVHNVYHSTEDRPMMTVATPLLDEQGQRVGVLAAHLNLERMDAIILERASLGQSGETYLVDRYNVFVSGERFGRDEFPAGVHSQGIDAALQGGSGFGLYPNYHGAPVIGVYRWLANRELALLVEMHQEEAFVPARQLAWSIFGIGLGSAGVLALAVYVLARRLTAPVFDLTRAAQRAAQGDLSQPVPVRGQDELGTLAEAFNIMQAGLLESHRQLEGYARTLEQRVAERTAELARRADQLALINRVGRIATSLLDLGALLPHVATSIRASFSYYAVLILLVDERAGEVYLSAAATPEDIDMLEGGLRAPLDAHSIVGYVARSGDPLVVDDVSREARYHFDERLPNTRSELALPLRVGQQVLGVLDLESADLNAFEADDVRVLRTLADQVAVAVRNAQLYHVEHERRQWAESLEQAGRELSSSLDLHQVPGRVLTQLAAVVPYERGAVILLEHGLPRIIDQVGFPEGERLASLPLPALAGHMHQHVLASGAPCVVDDVSELPAWQPVDWLPLNRSWLGVPLISKDRVIGLISLTRRPAGAFRADESVLASTFAAQAAIALENAGLYDEIARFNEQLEHMVQSRTEELDRAYRRLERLDKTKSDFINVAAHELRTPLTLILGYAQLLGPALEHDPQLKMLVDGILAGEGRLLEIVNGLLDLSKITSQALNVCKEMVNLAGVVEDVRVGFEAALKERHLTLRVEGLDSLPAIEADAGLLSKVFYHLVVNAIKYTPDGGSITIGAQAIPAAGEEGMIEITVCDTGIGIDPAHQELIFEKFYQTGPATSHSSGKTKFKGGGPGLGLSIVRGIVHAHAGRVWVESEGYDEAACPGSCFHVLLPVKA